MSCSFYVTVDVVCCCCYLFVCLHFISIEFFRKIHYETELRKRMSKVKLSLLKEIKDPEVGVIDTYMILYNYILIYTFLIVAQSDVLPCCGFKSSETSITLVRYYMVSFTPFYGSNTTLLMLLTHSYNCPSPTF